MIVYLVVHCYRVNFTKAISRRQSAILTSYVTPTVVVGSEYEYHKTTSPDAYTEYAYKLFNHSRERTIDRTHSACQWLNI